MKIRILFVPCACFLIHARFRRRPGLRLGLDGLQVQEHPVREGRGKDRLLHESGELGGMRRVLQVTTAPIPVFPTHAF